MQLSQYVLPNEKGQSWTDLITVGVGASSAPIIKKSQLEDWLSYLLEWASKWNGMNKF
jgi:hypothetical protein